MRSEGVVCNANSFANVSLCGSLKNEVAGLQVFSQVIVSGLQRHVSVANSLITMLGNIGRVQEAEKLFYRMEEREGQCSISIIGIGEGGITSLNRAQMSWMKSSAAS
jgi:pentatricopeptide repeat protein